MAFSENDKAPPTKTSEESANPSLIHSLMDSKESWQHVRSGKSNTSEKVIVGAETTVAAVAIVVGAKIGLGGTAAKAESEALGAAIDLPATSPLKAGLNRVFVEADGERRPLDVFIPERLHPEKPTPLIMALHGVAGGGDARGLMERETGLNSLAQEMAAKDGVGAIIAYPVAKTKVQPLISIGKFKFGKVKVDSWNSEGGGITETLPGYDDVNYLKSTVDTLKNNSSLNIDSTSQHIIGFSEGGQFAIHTHNSLPHYFASVGSIHGTVLGTEAAAVEGNRAAFVSVLGTKDYMLPIEGGRGFMTATGFPKLADSQPLMQAPLMARANGITDAPTVYENGLLKVTRYAGSAEQPAVTEFTVTNGKHAIDGVRGKGGWPIVGSRNRDFEAIDKVVHELMKHRLPDGSLNVSRTLVKAA